MIGDDLVANGEIVIVERQQNFFGCVFQPFVSAFTQAQGGSDTARGVWNPPPPACRGALSRIQTIRSVPPQQFQNRDDPD
jgi:hypothetical protein